MAENIDNKQNIMVSVICNTYNHEDYIRDALESFVMQKTNFAYEVLVHDDASTDNTANIVREYEEKYPDIIKPIYQTENQYSQGIKITTTYQVPRAKGKYIALCEGDDYWTDPLKLQKQFDIMEQNPNCSLCSHIVQDVNAETKKVVGKNPCFAVPELIKGEDYIKNVLLRGHYLQLSSYFFRNSLMEKYRAERNTFHKLSHAGDVALLLFLATEGAFYVIQEIMSNYRVMSKSSVSKKALGRTPKQSCEYIISCSRFHRAFNEYTNYKFDDLTRLAIKRSRDACYIKQRVYKFNEPNLVDEFGELTIEDEKNISRKVKKFKQKRIVKKYLPWAVFLYRKIKNKKEKL